MFSSFGQVKPDIFLRVIYYLMITSICRAQAFIPDTPECNILVELVPMLYKAIDNLNSYVRVVMLDFSKTSDHINHHLLLDKLQSYRLPAHILRCLATFLLDKAQRVKIGKEYSHSGHPNGGVPQGTLSGPKCFLVYINDLRTTVPLYKYVGDSTLFEKCDRKDVSVIQRVGWYCG